MACEIAIIDSGINSRHSHVGRVAGGVGFFVDTMGNIEKSGDYSDHIGHGTAIAGIIRENNPQAELIAVKIFSTELRASLAQLIAALEWAIERNIKIIHLSLGIYAGEGRELLLSLCKKAADQNQIIIASGRRFGGLTFPAAFDSVVGVCKDDSLDKNEISFDVDNSIEFAACGFARTIPGIPREANFRGHSFAAARLTARVAEIVESEPDISVLDVKKILKQQSHC